MVLNAHIYNIDYFIDYNNTIKPLTPLHSLLESHLIQNIWWHTEHASVNGCCWWCRHL